MEVDQETVTKTDEWNYKTKGFWTEGKQQTEKTGKN